ncbi:MAG: hypothetical protein J7L72_01060 [Candidatus Aminicenantes bacterium]|nr:hypothetical protein [Candidatus Aminicenantes bacterium]
MNLDITDNQTYILLDLYGEQVKVKESLMKFRCGRGDIEDLAFGVLFLSELGKAELRAYLTHGRVELRSSREHSAKNGVNNL